MSRKSQSQQRFENTNQILFLLSFAILILFIPIIIIQYFRIKNTHGDQPIVIKDFKGSAHGISILSGAGLVLVCVAGYFYNSHIETNLAAPGPLFLAVTFVVAGVFVFLFSITKLAFALAGHGINVEKLLLITAPQRSSDKILDTRLLNPFFIEQLSISDIDTITREGGKTLHIVGRFGSKAIEFSEKQLRDELMSHLLKLRPEAMIEPLGDIGRRPRSRRREASID